MQLLRVASSVSVAAAPLGSFCIRPTCSSTWLVLPVPLEADAHGKGMVDEDIAARWGGLQAVDLDGERAAVTGVVGLVIDPAGRAGALVGRAAAGIAQLAPPPQDTGLMPNSQTYCLLLPQMSSFQVPSLAYIIEQSSCPCSPGVG